MEYWSVAKNKLEIITPLLQHSKFACINETAQASSLLLVYRSEFISHLRVRKMKVDQEKISGLKMFIRFSRHFFSIIHRFHAVFWSLFALIVGVSVVVRHIEQMPFGEALYFSFITGLTIGYGDIVVKTPIARLLVVFLGLIGMIFTGLMVAAAVRAVEESMKDMN
jgi:voltage-gated potassium channel